MRFPDRIEPNAVIGSMGSYDRLQYTCTVSPDNPDIGQCFDATVQEIMRRILGAQGAENVNGGCKLGPFLNPEFEDNQFPNDGSKVRICGKSCSYLIKSGAIEGNPELF